MVNYNTEIVIPIDIIKHPSPRTSTVNNPDNEDIHVYVVKCVNMLCSNNTKLTNLKLFILSKICSNLHANVMLDTSIVY